jgi:hypothetical protein
MRVILHPGAERDVAEAAAFYEFEASPALAGRFVAEFERVAKLLLLTLALARLVLVADAAFRPPAFPTRSCTRKCRRASLSWWSSTIVGARATVRHARRGSSGPCQMSNVLAAPT